MRIRWEMLPTPKALHLQQDNLLESKAADKNQNLPIFAV